MTVGDFSFARSDVTVSGEHLEIIVVAETHCNTANGDLMIASQRLAALTCEASVSNV